MVKQGLAARGWTYINCDAGWQEKVARVGDRRSPGPIRPNEKFSDMKEMIADIHGLGLKVGLYSSPMIYTWGSGGGDIFVGTGEFPVDASRKLAFAPFGTEVNGIGSTRHCAEDARQWAEWGVDWIKYDWGRTEAALGAEMRRALDDTGRRMILQLCTQCRVAESNEYMRIAELVRGSEDSLDVWEGHRGVPALIRAADAWRGYSGAGHWYDPDMLVIGDLQTGTNRLTAAEQTLHFAYWALAPAPLVLSCDLEKISPLALELATNEELIAINQDALVVPAKVEEHDGLRVATRPLVGGRRAWGYFNLTDEPRIVQLPFAGVTDVRDVLSRRPFNGNSERLSLPPHSARVFTGRIIGATPPAAADAINIL